MEVERRTTGLLPKLGRPLYQELHRVSQATQKSCVYLVYEGLGKMARQNRETELADMLDMELCRCLSPLPGESANLRDKLYVKVTKTVRAKVRGLAERLGISMQQLVIEGLSMLGEEYHEPALCSEAERAILNCRLPRRLKIETNA